MSLLKDITTDEYGQSYDLVSIEACIGFALGLILFTISCFTRAVHFSLLEYAGGFSTLVMTTAAVTRIKSPAIPNTPTIPGE